MHNGSLEVHQENGSFMFSNAQFCLAFTDIPTLEEAYSYDYDYNESDYSAPTVRAAYYVCNNEFLPERGDAFSSLFYPISIFLSSLFVLLTITVYILVQDLRKNTFGKLTLGFLVNVFISYFCIGVRYSLQYSDPTGETYLQTSLCVFLGYAVQHSFIALFFWTNAMAINITRRFSNIVSLASQVESTSLLVLNVIYAQGNFISIASMLIDHPL